jgi:hypothetical protein
MPAPLQGGLYQRFGVIHADFLKAHRGLNTSFGESIK